jgi:hypothetical protein
MMQTPPDLHISVGIDGDDEHGINGKFRSALFEMCNPELATGFRISLQRVPIDPGRQ